ncbi:zinc finger and BTB domain-containing protein 39 isoform X1 [Sebastes fasciatus]|uniref:zinc finger and BTB domain-containing protein 39 isoform X1 n=2 Tax=Sebastes fasciatus TaxID=394691 RepID=UPI003D9E5E0B
MQARARLDYSAPGAAAGMRIQLQGPGHAASLLAELNSCRQSRRYCDVVLQVGNRTFAAHRAVLACAGTYFRNLFTRAAASSTPAFSLEFISPANFEKLLTFVYTGEILIDLIDVGVLYELAERLGVSELVRACHATFPDLQASVSANCKPGSPGDLPLDSSMVAAAASTAAAVSAVSASSVCSSAASCSSLSSSAAPTPAAAPSPLFQTRATGVSHEAHTGTLPLGLKVEDVESHIGYGQMSVDQPLPGGHSLLTSRHSSQCDAVLPTVSSLQLKIEPGLEEEEAAGGCEDRNTGGQMVSESAGSSADAAPSDSCSFPDSSAQLGAEACTPTSSSGEPHGDLQVVSVEGGRPMFEKVEEEENEEREALKGNGAMEGTEEEQWRQLAGEIIELSDDENYMEEGDEEEDEDELVYVENGEHSSSQVTGNMLPCKACAVPLPADPDAIRRHAETHLTELGLCRVCGASFQDRDAGVTHSLSHVGVQLFTCDMCHMQFCSQNKLLRHHRQTACSYTIPQGALTSSSQSLDPELQCAVCAKTLSKDFQTVKDHLLSHVCPQSLSCGVCHLPQLSLCSLLWHALAHLSLPVFTCPHCARCFVERSMLDRHMTTHAEEAAAKEREQLALRAYRVGGGGMAGVDELHCFLCPQTFRSASAFQYHLSLHTTESLGGGGGVRGQGWFGKRKADQALECLPSSSSQREVGGLIKMSNMGLGLGMSFSLSDKFLQGALHSVPSGVLTNGSSGQDGGVGATAVRGKWYRCRYCGKCFAHSGEFTYHLRIHTGEKPYQCKVCLRFFRGRSTMICHLKTHAGALMYRCTVCGLFFSTLKLVSSHMELHTEHLPPDFNIEQTFMYNDHSKEPLPNVDT